jgi:putative NIF3 family GTP cyclohydrolase 1 type 2
MEMSRRSFLVSTAGLAAVRLHGQEPLTAGTVIQRIKERVGVPWRTETVDRIIAGVAATPVRGIATTMMATFDVVKRAAAAGRNLVITHEPTFYSHQDTTDALKQDATYQAKDSFLREHDMVVFRFHDHWHAMRPDGIATGMARDLGWDRMADPSNPRQFVFPGVRLDALVKDMQTRVGIKAMRVVGDPAMTVKRAAASWGYYTFAPPNITIARPDVDLFVVGETREWETVEYVQDQIAAGQTKALIVMGHVVSEQSGMRYCAEWLKTFVPEAPIEFIAAPEPFWTPS